MAILIASTLLETETEAWYSFYVDTMEDVKGLPTSKSTGSSYKVKKFAKPASQAYCIEMAAQYVLDGNDEWRLLYAIRDDVADAILKNVEEIKQLVANTSASEQAAAQSASAANAVRLQPASPKGSPRKMHLLQRPANVHQGTVRKMQERPKEMR